eukprot:CAMPEP_0118649010 /NCGR_PEP_ID=MMETSP0785-20121206/9474_1 /TAXON_ID=91992 /ORGANISM="Bolidomonas pacifica, Strain CCMP 1866" /LENGTH=237 /DNA_ID=CAMNT_0006541267 /DNA_START=178 /DNA_END=891 /DNA_ORIENTATION=+
MYHNRFLPRLLLLLLSCTLSSSLEISRHSFIGGLATTTFSPLLNQPSSPLSSLLVSSNPTTKIKIELGNTASGNPLTLQGTLNRSWSPNGYDHFLNLVQSSYYTNTPIFRVVPNFIAQFGLNPDPDVTRKYSTPIKDDPIGAGPGNDKYTLTFATAGPNTRTTQIFLNYNDNHFLDKQGFTPFGSVEAFDVKEIYDGYGEGAPRGKGPDQNMLRVKGEAYMESYPKMTRILSIEVVE